MRNHNRDRDWKLAGEECLTTALDRARVLVQECTNPKELESLIKTVAEVVGFATHKARGVADAREDDD